MSHSINIMINEMHLYMYVQATITFHNIDADV
jgi:hypothetical protein